ncbi:hypothetical protein BPA_0900004 [Borrelia parkeri SLO]|uniref:Variable outer membrane protein n=1 Tax=Borrelia parkeri SLO TaxID=1313294 RepID=A0ABN4C5P3_BORPR|nr:hypothetical protein BPA_0900004 [Borrelia parkeri SLO]
MGEKEQCEEPEKIKEKKMTYYKMKTVLAWKAKSLN